MSNRSTARSRNASSFGWLSSRPALAIGLLASVVTIVAFILALAPHEAPSEPLVGQLLAGNTSAEYSASLAPKAAAEADRRGWHGYSGVCAFAYQINVYSCILGRTAHPDCESALVINARVSRLGTVTEVSLQRLGQLAKCPWSGGGGALGS